MNITYEWLEKNGACEEAKSSWSAENNNNHAVMINRLMDNKRRARPIIWAFVIMSVCYFLAVSLS